MGLDIEAVNTETGEIVAEFRIAVWDYCTNALWEYVFGYQQYGGVFTTEELKEKLKLVKNSSGVDYTKAKEDSLQAMGIMAHTVEKVTGVPVQGKGLPEQVEDPDRILTKYDQLRTFFESAIEEKTLIKINVF